MARISRVGVSRGREGASTLKQIASTLAKNIMTKAAQTMITFFHQINQPGRQLPKRMIGFLLEGEYLARNGGGRPGQTEGRRRGQR